MLMRRTSSRNLGVASAQRSPQAHVHGVDGYASYTTVNRKIRRSIPAPGGPSELIALVGKTCHGSHPTITAESLPVIVRGVGERHRTPLMITRPHAPACRAILVRV
ncbi:hypothetical protein VTO73DRAFT_14171 [Trametes versicolor]